MTCLSFSFPERNHQLVSLPEKPVSTCFLRMNVQLKYCEEQGVKVPLLT